MDWIKKSEKLPDSPSETGILTFSPIYGLTQTKMRYRIMNAQFVKICTDVTHWAYIKDPENQTGD